MSRFRDGSWCCGIYNIMDVMRPLICLYFLFAVYLASFFDGFRTLLLPCLTSCF